MSYGVKPSYLKGKQARLIANILSISHETKVNYFFRQRRLTFVIDKTTMMH